MPSGVVAVCMRPRKPFVAVVSLASGPPLVVDLSKDKPAPAALDTVDLTGTLMTMCVCNVCRLYVRVKSLECLAALLSRYTAFCCTLYTPQAHYLCVSCCCHPTTVMPHPPSLPTTMHARTHSCC